MRFIHTILPAGLMAFTITAQAVPNMWSSGYGMGLTEYIITSPEQVMLNLSCTGNPDDQNILQHHVMLTLPDGTQVDATVGSERFLAWWPGEEVPGIDLGEAMGPEWDPAEGITLTWTYEDGTTGGPADL